MAVQIGEIGEIPVRLVGRLGPWHRLDPALGKLTELGDVLDRHHLEPLHERGLARVAR